MILQAEHAPTHHPPPSAFWGPSPAWASSSSLLPEKHHLILGALGPGTEVGSGAKSLLGCWWGRA